MCDKQATQQARQQARQHAMGSGECAITAPAIIAPSQQTERLGTKRAHLRGLLLSSERYVRWRRALRDGDFTGEGQLRSHSAHAARHRAWKA